MNETFAEIGTNVRRVLALVNSSVRSMLARLILIIGACGSAYCSIIGSKLRFPDERQYVAIASNLAKSNLFSLDGETVTAHRPPGWPLILSLFYRFGISTSLIRNLNVLFMCISVLAVFFIAKKFMEDRFALIAAACVGFYPVTFFTMGTFYPQTFALALLTLATWSALRVQTNPTDTFSAVVTGACLGWLAITVPQMGVVTLVIYFWLRKNRASWKALSWVVILAGLPAAIWSLINTIRFKQLIFISSNNGANLLLGNSPNTGWRSGGQVDLSAFYDQIKALKLNEIQSDSYLRGQALEWILSHPFQAIALYLAKLANFFSPFDNLATRGQTNLLISCASTAIYGTYLIMAIKRITIGRLCNEERLLLHSYLAFAIVMAVAYTRVRYRAPLDWTVILLSVHYLSTTALGTRISSIRRQRL